MYEIKRIVPISLAKYMSIVAGLTFLLLGVVRFIYFKDWKMALIDVLITIALYYALFWIIGYLFALCYNFFASKTRGIILEIKEFDEVLLEKEDDVKSSKKEDKKIEKDDDEDDIKIENKFVV